MLSYIPVYNRLKNIFIVSSTTLLSRVSGFARDACFFSIFGLSEISAAFLFAFTIPNLFRRLLGEGALSSAIIPILSDQYIKHGKEAVGALLTKIIFRLFFVVMIITLIGTGLSAVITKCSSLEYKWIISAHFIILVLPYMIFVCVAAMISAALNVLGHFFTASLNAIWLNISMIIALMIGKFCGSSEIQKLDILSFGVIIGGIVQCVIPMLVFRIHISSAKKKSNYSYNDELQEILRLFWPGFFGAAVAQINLLASRSLAYFYSASSVSVLYLANRLTELPLGIFASAISIVFFPDLSKSAVSSKESASPLRESFNQGITALLWILLPSALGLFCIKKEILSTFFEWGNFGVSDSEQILPILSIYCISIPFYGISSFLVRSFHAIKDMRTPVYIGCIMLVINILLTIFLMEMYGVLGIACANTLSVILQVYMLYNKLHKEQGIFIIVLESRKIFAIIFGLVSIYAVILFGRLFCKSALSVLLYLTPAAALSYLATTYLFFTKRTK